MKLKRQQYWAIIITLLFHTVLFWALFFSEIKKNKKEKVFEIELTPETIPAEKNEQEEEKLKEIADKQLQEMMSNRAAKRFVQGEQMQQQAEAIDDTEQLKQEFEERKQQSDALKKAQLTPQKVTINKPKRQTPKQDTTKHQTVFYVGNSRVEYFLANRYRIKLPIPVYKCEGEGKVEVAIWVDKQGVVTNAEVIKGRSGSASDCMREAALNAAWASSFSELEVAPLNQTGRIIYQFVAQ